MIKFHNQLVLILSIFLTGSICRADMCLDLFSTVGRGIGSNEAVALVYNSKAGRAELHHGYVTGRGGSQPTDRMELNIATGILTFENRAVFQAIVPFRAHAKVLDTRDTLKRIEDRIVTVIGLRSSPASWDAPEAIPEYVGQLENGTLVRILELLDNRG